MITLGLLRDKTESMPNVKETSPKSFGPSCKCSVGVIVSPLVPDAVKENARETGALFGASVPYDCAPLGEEIPDDDNKVAIRLDAAPPPMFCSEKPIVTVSPESIPPLVSPPVSEIKWAPTAAIDGNGLLTVDTRMLVLLERLGSGAAALTIAVLVIKPRAPARAEIRTLVELKAGKAPRLQKTTPPACAQLPREGVAEMNDIPAGKVLVRKAPGAAYGPALVTIRL